MKLLGTEEQLRIAAIMDATILRIDRQVKAENAPIMSIKNAVKYNEKEVFKYGLAITQNHISFHSMIMYAHPDIFSFSKELLPKARFNKGCINIKSSNTFDLEAFEQILIKSSQADFSPVLERYKNQQ